MVNELPVDKLRRKCAPDVFGCASSAQIEGLNSIIGQERAVRAL